MRHSIITKKRHWFYSPIISVVLIIFVILGIISVVGAYTKQHEATMLRKQYEQELAEVKKHQEDLAEKITNLSTERGLESEIRDRYRVVKPGEQLLIVVEHPEQEPIKTSEESLFLKIRQFVGF